MFAVMGMKVWVYSEPNECDRFKAESLTEAQAVVRLAQLRGQLIRAEKSFAPWAAAIISTAALSVTYLTSIGDDAGFIIAIAVLVTVAILMVMAWGNMNGEAKVAGEIELLERRLARRSGSTVATRRGRLIAFGLAVALIARQRGRRVRRAVPRETPKKK